MDAETGTLVSSNQMLTKVVGDYHLYAQMDDRYPTIRGHKCVPGMKIQYKGRWHSPISVVLVQVDMVDGKVFGESAHHPDENPWLMDGTKENIRHRIANGWPWSTCNVLSRGRISTMIKNATSIEYLWPERLAPEV